MRMVKPIISMAIVQYKRLQRTRISGANKSGIPPYGPYIPRPNIFPKNSETRNFLLAKRKDDKKVSMRTHKSVVVNSERAAMYAPSFKTKMETTLSKVLLGISSSVCCNTEKPKLKSSSFKLSFKKKEEEMNPTKH